MTVSEFTYSGSKIEIRESKVSARKKYAIFINGEFRRYSSSLASAETTARVIAGEEVKR
jgi:hypothetical protein